MVRASSSWSILRAYILCRCDGYNVATALAAFIVITYGFSIFFDIKDIYASRASPRTRT